MGNYNATARSNYVRVKNLAEVRRLLAERAPEITICESHKNPGTVAFLVGGMSDTGCWPSIYPLDADGRPDDDAVPDEFGDFLAPHLEEGEVLILVEAGAEKLRYVAGWARAVRVRNGAVESLTVSLDDIYTSVRRQWRVEPTAATY